MAKKVDEKILRIMTITERFKYINDQKRIKTKMFYFKNNDK